MSLDGFIAGPNQTLEDVVGVAAFVASDASTVDLLVSEPSNSTLDALRGGPTPSPLP
jgi:hypothetical protein